MRIALISASIALAFAQAVLANPTGGTVTGGSATISSSGSTVTVNSSTNNTIINWQSFSVGAGETTRFNQPSSSSTVLNRVTGPDTSSIAGTLSSNGHLFLVNPNGIVIAPGAQIDVASLLISTFSVDDASFLAGNPTFSITGSGGTIEFVGGSNAFTGTGTIGALTNGGGTGVITTFSAGSAGTTGVIATASGQLVVPAQAIRPIGIGTGTITLSGNTMQISQTSPNAIISTGSFATGSSGTINLVAPSASSTTLTRSGSNTPLPVQITGVLFTNNSGSGRSGPLFVSLEKREVPF